MLNFKAKPIIAMLHLKGNSDEEIMERMMKETEIYYRNGIDAVLVENYFGNKKIVYKRLSTCIKTCRTRCLESIFSGITKKPLNLQESTMSILYRLTLCADI